MLALGKFVGQNPTSVLYGDTRRHNYDEIQLACSSLCIIIITFITNNNYGYLCTVYCYAGILTISSPTAEYPTLIIPTAIMGNYGKIAFNMSTYGRIMTYGRIILMQRSVAAYGRIPTPAATQPTIERPYDRIYLPNLR